MAIKFGALLLSEYIYAMFGRGRGDLSTDTTKKHIMEQIDDTKVIIHLGIR
jgi:hypothetical protein